MSDSLKGGGELAAKRVGVSPIYRYSNNITECCFSLVKYKKMGCYETTEGKTGFATGFLQIL